MLRMCSRKQLGNDLRRAGRDLICDDNFDGNYLQKMKEVMNTSRCPQGIVHFKSWCTERKTIHSCLLLFATVAITIVQEINLKEIRGLVDFSRLREDFEEWHFPTRGDMKSRRKKQHIDSIEKAQNEIARGK